MKNHERVQLNIQMIVSWESSRFSINVCTKHQNLGWEIDLL